MGRGWIREGDGPRSSKASKAGKDHAVSLRLMKSLEKDYIGVPCTLMDAFKRSLTFFCRELIVPGQGRN